MAIDQLAVKTPYVGPRPFGRSEKDQERFFGRELEVDAILSRLYGQYVTLVCAASGAGKTSLFNAGVTPRLQARDVQVLPMARVGGVSAEDFGTRSVRGVRNVYMHNALMTLAPEREPSALKDMALKEFLASWDRERKHRRGRPELRVVAFDQFEEIFTLYRSGSQREQVAFFKQVAQALEADPDLRVVFLMREEYLAQLEPFAWLLPPDLNAYFRLEPLDADSALQAITGPLEKTTPKRAFGEGVAEALVKELRKVHRKGSAGTATTILGPYVEPMQLQGVCELLWLHLPPGARTITHEHRRRFGNVDRALATLYQRAIQQAVGTGEVDERTLRDWFDRKLITPVRTRGTVYSDGQRAAGIPMRVVKLLEDSHIVRVQHRAELPWYELAHDRWIGPILEANERWRAALKNPLTEPARVWGDQQEPENLLRGQRLRLAGRWAAMHGSELNPLERRFLTASQREAEQQTRERRQARQLARLVEDLQKQRRILQSYEVIASANASLGEDPERSVLLALYAVAATSAAQGAVTPEAEEALRRSVQALRVKRRLAHHGKVRAVAFSPDGSRLATTGEDGTIGVWEVASGRRVLTLTDQPLTYAIAYSQDGSRIVTACQDGTARIWHIASRDQPQMLIQHSTSVFGVDVSADGRRLATAGEDGTVRIWDTASGEQLLLLENEARVWDVAFSPDGRLLASAGQERAAKVWDAASGDKLLTLAGHRHDVQCVTFSPDGRQLATGSLDLTAKIWDATSGEQLRSLSGHSGTVSAVAFSADSALLATASIDSTVKLWGWGSEQALDTLRGHHEWVTDVDFGPDGRTLATAGWDGTARIWEVPHGRETVTLAHAGKAAHAVAFTSDGSRIATAESGGVVRIFESMSGHPVTTAFGHVDRVNAVAFSPDGTRLATASSDWGVKLWDASIGRELRILAGHAGQVFGVQWSPDGRTVASGGEDRTVKIWDTESTGSPRTILCRDVVSDLAFSPDSRRLATASWDGAAEVWDLHDGGRFLVLSGHEQALEAVAFSPDGQRLATAGDDRIVKLWDATSGALLRELAGHTSGIRALAFSPDGLRLATASWDSTAKVWELATGKQVLTLSDHGDKLNSLAFSSDGRLLATAGEDGTTRLHLVTVDDLVALARRRVTRGLSPDECRAWLRRSEPEEPECPEEIVAVGMLVEARVEADAGRVDETASALREALRLDPNLGVDPEVEVHRMAASALLAKARDCTVRKDVQGLARSLRVAGELDPELGLHPDSDARRIVASYLVEEARWLAYAQDLEAAASRLRAAVELWEKLDLDPDLEVRRVAAVAQVSRGRELAEDGDIEQALVAYRRAEELHPKLDIPASAFNTLCWFGSILGHAAQVQGACDHAVQLLPHPDIRDSRGVARALNGDYQGAIEDFEAFVESQQAHERKRSIAEKRRKWVASLQVGHNPFDQETLADLRNE